MTSERPILFLRSQGETSMETSFCEFLESLTIINGFVYDFQSRYTCGSWPVHDLMLQTMFKVLKYRKICILKRFVAVTIRLRFVFQFT